MSTAPGWARSLWTWFKRVSRSLWNGTTKPGGISRSATHCRPRPGCESASHCCAAAKNVQQWAQLNDEDWCWPGHQLPFGRLWYGEPDAISNAIEYAKFFSRSHDAVIRVYDDAGNVIETHEHTGDFKEW